jgi:predicted HTH domain antitoxin
MYVTARPARRILPSGENAHRRPARCARGTSASLATTIGHYVLSEVSLGKAAERTGVTRWGMEEILQEAGVKPRLGPPSMDDLEDEIDVALEVESASRFHGLLFLTRQCSATTRVQTPLSG